MIRAIAAPGNPASRIENRVGESAANPYLYMAAQILCGIDGIEQKEPVPEPVNRPYGNHDSQTRKLPSNLGEAIRHFSQSTFVREALGKDTVNYLTQIKQAEWDRYLSSVSEWEHREYFSLF